VSALRFGDRAVIVTSAGRSVGRLAVADATVVLPEE
jgi:hypothetical protein